MRQRNVCGFPALGKGEASGATGCHRPERDRSGVSAVARILVVDDEPDILDAVTQVLQRCGHSVANAADGATAAEMHHCDEFDLIVSDLVMPGLDGIELAKAVRADIRPDIPILLVTASASAQDLAAAHQAGVTAYLSKPFKLADLRDRVEALLAAA
jgi:CheY-like chemotaxis protein